MDRVLNTPLTWRHIRDTHFYYKTLCSAKILQFSLDSIADENYGDHHNDGGDTAQKMKFSIIDSFSKCGQIRSFLQIRSHLLKKPLMEISYFVPWDRLILLVGSVGYYEQSRDRRVVAKPLVANRPFQLILQLMKQWICREKYKKYKKYKNVSWKYKIYFENIQVLKYHWKSAWSYNLVFRKLKVTSWHRYFGIIFFFNLSR